MVCDYKSINKPSHLWGVNFTELIQRTSNMKNASVRESAHITYDIGLLPSHNRKQHFGLYFILCHREWVFVAGGSLRWLWSMVELVGAPVERFRCWRPSVVGPHLLLCGAVRPVVVEQWRVQSAKCRLGPKCWPSLAEETPHYTQESPAFSAHLPCIVIFIKIMIMIISSVRSSNSHPDLLVITTSTTTPLFQIHTGPQHWTFTFWATTAI